jgi:diguanylate cyclase (GGDEF)-like protein
MGLSWINAVAAQANAEFGGILIALDRTGHLVAYQPNPAPGWKLGEPNESALAAAIMGSDNPAFEADDPAGVTRIFGVARLPELGLTVAVGLDRRDVVGAIDRGFSFDLLFLLAVAAASGAGALLLAEFGILRGVRILKAAALRLKAGKMGLRVKLPPYVAAELHDLAATYNAMTAEFERLAYLDRLTGLPNRRYLERHLSRGEAAGHGPLPAAKAVIAIDLDGFKPVNDNHGHAVGDRVLTIIARRIASVVEDRGMLFRVGGDEFVALAPLRNARDRATARALAEEIRAAMEQAIEHEGLLFAVACSVGIALVPEDAETLSGALVIADAALYEAKRTGRNRVVDKAPPLAPEAVGRFGGEAGERGSRRAELGAPW